MNDQELKNRLTKFMQSFELVFEHDWEFTQDRISNDPDGLFIEKNGTFITPRISDEDDNWANRGSLLEDYRQLVEAMKAQGIHEELPGINASAAKLI